MVLIRQLLTATALVPLLAPFSLAPGAYAQTVADGAWIQIEARNSRGNAEERLSLWANQLDGVHGFRLGSGWHAVAIGPFPDREAAQARLQDLLAVGAIPFDSFVADARLFREEFGASPVPPAPSGIAQSTLPPPAPPAAPVAAAPQAPVPQPPAASDPASVTPTPETLGDARRYEVALPREARADIQRALQFEGLYSSGIDGAFGAGTRKSIAEWQSREGAEPTGVLSQSQTERLVSGWKTEVAALGLELVRDDEAGIEALLPMALVEFDRYAPPFAQYRAKGDSGLDIWLISQPGSDESLAALASLLEAQSFVPPGGESRLRGPRYEFEARDGTREVHIRAELVKGNIRGYLVSASGEGAARGPRVAQSLQTSFKTLGDQVLDPGLVPLDEAAKAGMISGIEPKVPLHAGSGFYISTEGHVMTASALLESCGEITLGADGRAQLVADLSDLGIAVLKPETPLAPPAVAELSRALPVTGSEISVAGFPFGAAVGLPAQTFGTLQAEAGLQAQAGRATLVIPSLAGDIGAPVLSREGLVTGVLLPQPADPARSLPEDLHEMAQLAAALPALQAQGLVLKDHAASGGAMAPEDINALGAAIAVQVSCWK